MPELLIRRARPVPALASRALANVDGPVDISIVDGVVQRIGPALERPAGGTEIDAEGRWIIPGLWDKHVHLDQWVAVSQRLDLSATSSAEAVLAAVAERLRLLPGRPVIGAGMRAALWPRPATVDELDAVSGSVPVVLVNGDLHHGWCNTAALDALGLARRNVVVAETEWFARYPLLDSVSQTTVSAATYRTVLEKAAGLGIVGVVDLEVDAPWDRWATRWEQGCDVVRIRWGVYPDGLDAVVAAGLRTGDRLGPRRFDGPDLTMGPLKIISDGSLGTCTAWCCEPYAGEPGNIGMPNFDQHQLVSLMETATAAGLDVATHAIGDRALAHALRAYAATGAHGSIEHVQLVTRESVREMARLRLTASVQPSHLVDDWAISDRVWPDRTHRCFALRWLWDAGVDLAFGSDAPVAALNPWVAIDAAVYRGSGATPWHPEQALTTAEALRSSVDHQRIGVGARGDVVLLDRDPLSAGELCSMAAALTVVGGKVVYDGRQST